MDTAHLHLSKNLSITFHIFPWHYKLWDELVRNSVWNRKKTNWKQGEIFTVQSALLQYVTFTVYIYIYIYIYIATLQYMPQFYSIWHYFTGYGSVSHHIFLLFFVYKERLCIVPDILNVFINCQLL